MMMKITNKLMKTAAMLGTAVLLSSFCGAAEPAWLVDFSSADAVYGCGDLHNISPGREEDGMRLLFSGSNTCEDPYLSLTLPSSAVDLAKEHWFAMLVKTEETGIGGELRFRSTSTGEQYPCQPFSYADTEDWQLIVVDLTDTGTMIYAPTDRTYDGNLINLRLDPFSVDCKSDIFYQIRAYGLYTSREDALTFGEYMNTENTTEKPEEAIPEVLLPDVDYGSFWRGEAFARPADDTVMRWLSMGFSDNYPFIVDTLLERGYRGIISNVNFNAQYLRDDSEFALLNRVYDYAEERNMALWIYDEYQWPSGKAFGLVLEGHPEFRSTGIEHKTITGTDGNAQYRLNGKDIAIQKAVLTDDSGTRTLETGEGDLSVPAAGKWTLDVYVLRYTYEGVENPADFATLEHVDLLNPAAVQRFIDVTYRKYRDQLGADFDRIEAFFTDEPQLGNRGMLSYAVWTDGMEDRFYEKFGYDLDIAAVFSGFTPEEKKMRLHYYQLVSELFREAYIDQIADWCEENGTASSGHPLFEENMNDQIETYGGDFLQFVGGMTIPGADLLWVDPPHLLSDNNIGSYMGLRYVASAAKNAGKSDVMVEWNPACVASNTSFFSDIIGTSIGGASLTRLLGVNIFNVIDHAHSYTIAENNRLNTYIGRMNTILDGAVESGDVALFYPIATVQALHNADFDHSSTSGGNTEAVELNRQYAKLCKSLLENHVLYTVIDDESLRGAALTEDGFMRIGNGAYRTIILAWTQYISAEAMEVLTEFSSLGGNVLFVGEIPAYSTGTDGDEEVAAMTNALAEGHFYNKAGTTVIRELAALANNRLTLQGNKNISMDALFCGDFHTDDKEITMLANSTSADGSVTVSWTDGYTGSYTVYYPGSGNIETAEGEYTLTVPAYESVFVIRDGTPVTYGAVVWQAAETEEIKHIRPAETTPDTTDTPADGTTAPTSAGLLIGISAAAAAVLAGLICVLVKRKRK
ncbi:MAG: hypothetical protein E7631_13385 [Ruminococcaceae bacterium]|nr:hypothetical protein [Oscillospiraceae bacterium]